MKGKLLLVLCLLLLLSCFSYSRFSQTVSKASSGSPVHNLNTGLNYTTIQEAIDANETMDGQTIVVDEGTYYENVVVNKSITLIGENRDNTIVDGNSSGSAFTLNVQNASLINLTAADAGIETPLHTVLDSRVDCAVLLNQTTNCLVDNVKTSDDSLVGICLYGSNQCKISGCECFGNQTSINIGNQQCGIVVLTSNNNTISNNLVSTKWIGVAAWGFVGNKSGALNSNEVADAYGDVWDPSQCENNVLIGNQILYSVDNGFDIYGLNNTVDSNRIWNNANGVVLDTSSCNFVSDNDISNSTLYGVWLVGSSNNTISENTIENNKWSVYFDNSFDVSQVSPNNNLFYHNNFLGNTYPPFAATSSVAEWVDGYPSGGNYWSDYNGTDTLSGTYQNESGSDGIGDKSYSIGPYNMTDRYPLMGMFSDFNATLQYQVQTVCNSTISDFQFNGTAISFNASGENGTAGFCRICIPTTLINGTFAVFVNGTEIPYALLPESNSTNSFLYFTFQETIITPEFPSLLILSLFLIATLLAVIIYKKKAVRYRRL